MKKAMLIVVAVMMAVTGSAMAHGRVYARPVYVHRPMYYRPMYVPRPVVVCPRPVYYAPAPIVVQQRPVVIQQQPVYTPAPAPIVQTLQIPEGFVESGRRLHGSGDDAGTVDWVKGTLNGKKVKIEFNVDGSRREIEND